jgi:hypothetical protein
MKKLVFADGTELKFTDSSTASNMVAVEKNFAKVDEIVPMITEENLKGAEFDGELMLNVIPVSCKAEKDGDNVVITFTNRQKTELEVINDKIEELQIAMTEIAEG